MTSDTPGPVRAVARVGVPSQERVPATLSPRRRPGHLGPFHVLQVFLAEAALLGLLAVLGQQLAVLIAVGLIGLLLLIVVLARQNGRWWLERRLLTWQFRKRVHSAPPAQSADVRLTYLRTLAPRLSLEEIPVGDDSVVGVARDDAGWFAVAEIASKAAMADGPSEGLPLDLLVSALNDTDQPGATLQVVTHTMAAPSLDLNAALPAAYSYKELMQRFGPSIPIDRQTWIAVRLDARPLAEAGAAGAEKAGPVVAALVRRLAKTLRNSGITSRVLDREGLLTALERSCDLQNTADTPPPREEWKAWHSGNLVHRSYWVRDWPTVAQAGALVDWLAAAPASMTSVAFVIVPDPEVPSNADMRCLVRVGAPADQLGEVCAAVDKGAHVAHATLFPLDGEQGPATYATAPTGGGPR